MAKALPGPPYIRLRRRTGDPLLYITSHGTTDAGYFAEAHVEYDPNDGYVIAIELEEHPHDIYGEGVDAARHDIPLNRVLAADLDQLHKTIPQTDHRSLQFLTLLDTVREGMCTDDPPPCGHEDVIDVTELGDSITPGICYWCPSPLVRVNDEWIPA
jgi:hypothetical protein